VSPESREWYLAAAQRLYERELGYSVRAQLLEGGPEIDESLERVGLTGDELQFKLNGFRRALSWFQERRGLRPFRRVLRWADVILGSLVQVVALLDPLKELKEGLEADVDDQLDEEVG
jgi:hypothetical protein